MNKKILVVTDSEKLQKAVEINLQGIWETAGWFMQTLSPLPLALSDIRLIIVALSSSQSEPVVALARASLNASVGQIPLLIISDRRFSDDPQQNIHHLDFPFTPEMLCQKVRQMLELQVPVTVE